MIVDYSVDLRVCRRRNSTEPSTAVTEKFATSEHWVRQSATWNLTSVLIMIWLPRFIVQWWQWWKWSLNSTWWTVGVGNSFVFNVFFFFCFFFQKRKSQSKFLLGFFELVLALLPHGWRSWKKYVGYHWVMYS